MGVDVRLFGENKRNLTQKQLDEVNDVLLQAYEAKDFEKFVLVEKEFDQEGIQETRKEIWIEFNTSMRYYGKGYERGNWSYLTGIINIMRALSGGRIYYFSDHFHLQEMLDFPFTIENQQEIDRYFVEVQEHPYRDNRQSNENKE